MWTDPSSFTSVYTSSLFSIPTFSIFSVSISFVSARRTPSSSSPPLRAVVLFFFPPINIINDGSFLFHEPTFLTFGPGRFLLPCTNNVFSSKQSLAPKDTSARTVFPSSSSSTTFAKNLAGRTIYWGGAIPSPKVSNTSDSDGAVKQNRCTALHSNNLSIFRCTHSGVPREALQVLEMLQRRQIHCILCRSKAL